MCPTTTALPESESGDMPFSLYEKISSSFHLTRNVHLQGWGEPLLHARLFDMVRIAKQAGCEVSLTTNGVLLNRVNAERIIQEGVDLIAVSIAGAQAETHESIRRGSNFNTLLDNINTLTALKKDAGAAKPKLVLSFLMTKINIKELPYAVELARKIGAQELVAANLDYTPTQAQADLKVFSLDRANPDFETAVAQAKNKSRELKLPLRVYPLVMDEMLMCELNPLQIVFISRDGSVSPCVYLNPAGHRLLMRIFCGEKLEIERFCLGTIVERDFLEIWKSPEYKAFRTPYEERMKCATGFLSRNGFGVADVEEMTRETEERLSRAPLPRICKTCYKAYGI